MTSTRPSRFGYGSIVLLLLGCLFGLAMAVVICGRRVEQTALKNQRLATALAEARRDLARLGASLAEARHAVVEEIGLELTGDAGDDRDEIRGALRRKLEVLIGKDPAGLDPEVVAEMLGGVRLRLREREYQADPTVIVLARRCFFRFTVKLTGEAGPKGE